jgi:hypothetical protein
MSGQGTERPDEVIEHGPVTLRRYRPDDLDALFGAVTESLDHLRPWMPWAAACTRESAALAGQAFRLPGVDRVEIVHDELNVASGQIPRKLGFTQVERRPLDPASPGGSSAGLVWRLLKTQVPNEVT